jgi:hypothetical protein
VVLELLQVTQLILRLSMLMLLGPLKIKDT